MSIIDTQIPWRTRSSSYRRQSELVRCRHAILPCSRLMVPVHTLHTMYNTRLTTSFATIISILPRHPHPRPAGTYVWAPDYLYCKMKCIESWQEMSCTLYSRQKCFDLHNIMPSCMIKQLISRRLIEEAQKQWSVSM